MAKRPKIGDMVATGNIQHGEMVDGKNVAKTFEPGDLVDLSGDVMEGLVACGAVRELRADTPGTPAEGAE
ncbi:hypothetical protein [Bradyrhizobium liaoningense]|uniref:hypothetical protein n=1 Tax=Bradyrhizobium liaoningense TaxID=43992 RepID=UPI001BA700B6|nr:hypothetical protein [Bradyrhizobium liaoningense]MBR1170534.1 hypothetical protein [Bradyrhizobium liaoningense]